MRRPTATITLTLALASTLGLRAGEASAQARFNAPGAPAATASEPTATGSFRSRAGLPPQAPHHLAPPPATTGQYGGGFIELLLTGRDPTPYARPVRPDPLAQPPAARVAALPSPHGAEPVGVPRPIDPRFRRQLVDYDGPHAPGTIVIDTPAKFLYHVQAGGRAVRYGIGVGRPGFEWAGVKTVSMKREWPDWRPPEQMLRRRPDLPRHMRGGEDNPLGARALYLGSSLYRIHGTNEPHTIGQALSSGCIRMTNEDVIDLYDKVRVGAKVIVI